MNERYSSMSTATNITNTYSILNNESPDINNQRMRRRRRKKQPSGVDMAASDEEPPLPSNDDLHTLDHEREPSIHRTSSFEGLGSLDTSPTAPALLKVHTTSSIQRVNSPTLHSLKRRDTFPSQAVYHEVEEHDDETPHVMTDRPRVKRTMSENMIASERDFTSSAPVSARNELLSSRKIENPLNTQQLNESALDNTHVLHHGNNHNNTSDISPLQLQHKEKQSQRHQKSAFMAPIQEGSWSPIPSGISPVISQNFATPIALATPPTSAAGATLPATTLSHTRHRDHPQGYHHRVLMPKLSSAQASSHEISDGQGFLDFITAELQPGPSYPTTDMVWGQTERDRVYNALLAVPFQLERLLWFGMMMCLDSFLAVYTLLPIRVLGAMGTLCRAVTHRSFFLRSSSKTSRKMVRKAENRNKESNAIEIDREEDHPTKLTKSLPSLQGDQLFDILCACMFLGVVLFLWSIKAGAIYFWVKELTQEFLKLSVLHTALELGDKICCSFGVDVLEALAASCTSFVSASSWSWAKTANVASDAVLAFALLLAHSTVLIIQALVFGVAMNSQKNTLLALLIASNFTEIKGTVLKRFDPTKLFVLAGQDIVERFHLFVVFAFVIVEEMVGTGSSRPSSRLLAQCAYVLLAEVVIDVTKHAVLGKFNEIRPGVYREFMKDMCEKVSSAQSHSMHRFIGFEPFAPAALFVRVAMSYAAMHAERVTNAVDSVAAAGSTELVSLGRDYFIGSYWRFLLGSIEHVRSVGLYAGAWIALTMFTILLGFAIKRSALQYLKSYDASRRRVGQVARSRMTVADNSQHQH